MEILCTKKLADQLPVPLQELTPPEPPSKRWCANLIAVQRRHALILTQEQTCFTVVLWGIRKRERYTFDQTVRQAVRDALRAYGVKEDVLRCYLPEAEPVTLRAAHRENRKTQVHMNRMIRYLSHIWEPNSVPALLQFPAMVFLNRAVFNEAGGDLTPLDGMLALLREASGREPVGQWSFLLRAGFCLDEYTVTREFLIPAGFTFHQLHQVLQFLFQWSCEGDYCFWVPNELNCCHIVPDQDAVCNVPDGPVSWSRTAPLGRYLHPGQRLVYDVSFPLPWDPVEIEVLALQEEIPVWGPMCTACGGISPPDCPAEGVGVFMMYRNDLGDTGQALRKLDWRAATVKTLNALLWTAPPAEPPPYTPRLL